MSAGKFFAFALAMGLFKYSILYLSLLFAAVAVDRLLPLARL